MRVTEILEAINEKLAIIAWERCTDRDWACMDCVSWGENGSCSKSGGDYLDTAIIERTGEAFGCVHFRPRRTPIDDV